MRFTSLFAVVAAGASLVAATGDEGTTTLTSTLTRTLTITECGPEVPDCPARTTTTTSSTIITTSALNTTTSTTTHSTPTPHWSVSNTTSFVGPTATPTTLPTVITTAQPTAPEPTTEGGAEPTIVPTTTPGAANGVFAQTGLVAAVAAVAVAALF